MPPRKPKDLDDTDRFASDRMRAIRLAIGMSQEQLADQLGVTFQQVQKYETGANRISIGRLVRIAAALGAPLSEFLPLDGTRDVQHDDPVRQLGLTARGVRIARAFNAMSGQGPLSDAVVTLLETMTRGQA